MDRETLKAVQTLTPQEIHEELKKLDLPTLHTACSIVGQVGFQHYGLSKDTRIAMEARKAHRFVAINCEEISKKLLKLVGMPEAQIETTLREIARQISQFYEMEKQKAGAQPVSERKKH